jgi:hypothetical protein
LLLFAVTGAKVTADKLMAFSLTQAVLWFIKMTPLAL